MRHFQIWPDMATYWGASFISEPHQHFYIQICLPASGAVRLRGRDGEWRTYRSALIPSGTRHEMTSDAKEMCLIYLDPLSVGAGLFAESCRILNHPAFEIGDFLTPADRTHLLELAQQLKPQTRGDILAILEKHTKLSVPQLIDPRIAASVEAIKNSPESVSLQSLAAEAGLSPGRLRHLFREETGFSFSAYRLWAKTLKAVRQLAASPNLMKAVHEGGFSDQPHFSHVFRRSFGMNPSIFTKGDIPFTAAFFPG
jgi:AraC-like DNA-binding protein